MMTTHPQITHPHHRTSQRHLQPSGQVVLLKTDLRIRIAQVVDQAKISVPHGAAKTSMEEWIADLPLHRPHLEGNRHKISMAAIDGDHLRIRRSQEDDRRRGRGSMGHCSRSTIFPRIRACADTHNCGEAEKVTHGKYKDNMGAMKRETCLVIWPFSEAGDQSWMVAGKRRAM